jgi:TolB-like protein/Flp pilus assembly protein TadD
MDRLADRSPDRVASIRLTGVRVSEGAGERSRRTTGVPPGALTALLAEVAAAPEETEAEPISLLPGAVVGRFEIIRELGRGGFGVVYEARDRDLGRQVALKLVRPGRITEEEGKVSREAETIARLTHPNLVTLYDAGHSEGRPYLVLELLRGKTLDRRIEGGPLPVQEAVHIATEVARGLAHAHAEGVIHRDLKPANVFVTNKGQVKILDFGMAHAFGRRRLSGGTPAYMAPEQWEDDPEDERTDVFALGVMLYRMLSGEYPFPKGEGRWAAEPATPRKLDVPGAPELAELVERMLDRTPKGRPRDGAAILTALAPTEEMLRARPADGAPPVHAKRRKATFGDLLAELKRRHVFRVMIGYGVFAFAVLQVTEPIMHGADLPNWVLKGVLVALVLGFPVAVVLAWLFDLTAQGVKRTPSSTDPGAAHVGRSRLLLPLAVAAAFLAIATAGAGGWLAWKRATGNHPVPAATGVMTSVAVLPFADLSPGKDQEYLSDGLAEEILNALARLEGLKVIGRASSFFFKGKDVEPSEVGRRLAVTSLLEGSVRREGNRIRVSARLVNASDGARIWSESYDREAGAAFAMQDEIARDVARALRVKLLDPGGGRAKGRSTSIEAYEQFLLGHQLLRAMSAESVRGARDAFERASVLDPGFAEAYAGLAEAWRMMGGYLPETSEETAGSARKSMAAAQKAVELDPELAEGYVARALYRQGSEWAWREALDDLERAMALSAGSAHVTEQYGRALAKLGRPQEALVQARRATELDPLRSSTWATLSAILRMTGDGAGAESAARRCMQISPDSMSCGVYLGLALMEQGKIAEAIDAFQRCPHEPLRLTGLAMVYHQAGDEAASRAALDALVEKYSATAAFQVAMVHARRGEADAAFEWLERARTQHDSGLAWVNSGGFRGIASDPRWKPFLGKLNLPLD